MTALKKINITDITRAYRSGRRLVVLTAYDALMAGFADRCGTDILLVGDSLGMTMLGYRTTIPVTLEQSLHHTSAVVRGTRRAMVIGDMPFMTYQVNADQALVNAARYLQEAGADGVKLEGGTSVAPTVSRLVRAGVPVLGHIGLLPQSVLAEGGYKIHGRRQEEAESLKADAAALQEAGAFGIVLEGMPRALAGEITRMMSIPTIGIGAGAECSGQVQVMHDILGMIPDFKPKHARQYANLAPLIENAFKQYLEDVESGAFPGNENTFE